MKALNWEQLAHLDLKVRRKAIELLKSAKNYALAVGADKVHCALLNETVLIIFFK